MFQREDGEYSQTKKHKNPKSPKFIDNLNESLNLR
jgi:hypothetical protein